MSDNNLVRAAGNAAASYLAVKLAVPVGALFLAFLLVAGMLADPGKALGAEPCGDRGQPDVEAGDPEGTHHEQQIANARTIDEVAAAEELSGRATLIALMTALQESSLLNIDYGDRDSVGLFQQRPTMGWGTEEEIMDPVYSATMFFMGGDGGDPPGLTDIDGWETMAPGDAAQAVQRSAYPDLYAGQESRARVIAAEAGIDLDRPGGSSGGPAQREEPDGGEDSEGGECYPDQNDEGEDGGDFQDGADPWPDAVNNPRNSVEAIKWARTVAATGGKDWYRLCLAFVAESYGWGGSGVNYAIDHYRQMPANMKHDGDRTPPPGALMYWDTGQRAGHVALYLGNGEVASNDIRRPGYIDIVDATDIETEWGATYLGWAPPYFPQGW